MKIRVPVTDSNCRVTPTDPFLISLTDRSDPSDTSDRNDPVNPDDLDNPDNPDGPDSSDSNDCDPYDNLPEYSLPELAAEFSNGCPDGYESHRTDFPANYIRVSVPETDLPIVKSWFGTATGGGGLPSDTLVSRMTKAVIGALKAFYDDCDMQGIYSRPFKLGYALRLADGRHYAHGDVMVMLPSDRAPQLPIRSRELNNSVLLTLTEFHFNPGTLHVSLDKFTLPDRLAALATHIDFYTTRQIDMITGDETVSGITTESVDGTNVPAWQYPRRSSKVIEQLAKADTSFRVIGSVAVTDARNGIENLQLPTGNRLLTDWTAFDILKDGPDEDSESGSTGGSGSGTDDPGASGSENPDTADDTTTDPENPATRYRNKIVEIGPLDLGYPEDCKRLRGISVRGIFDRLPADNEIRTTVYGSHHRDRWHRIAAARGPHIRLLRAVGYRWYKVVVKSAYGATLDAVTFEVII